MGEANGVKGYPTIKWGDPADLQDYQGGRTYSDLEKFATENLKPVCSPKNIDLCDDDKKAEIAKLQAMPPAELEAAIAAKKKKDKTIADVKASGLGLMKAVKASAPTGNDELKRDDTRQLYCLCGNRLSQTRIGGQGGRD